MDILQSTIDCSTLIIAIQQTLIFCKFEKFLWHTMNMECLNNSLMVHGILLHIISHQRYLYHFQFTDVPVKLFPSGIPIEMVDLTYIEMAHMFPCIQYCTVTKIRMKREVFVIDGVIHTSTNFVKHKTLSSQMYKILFYG